VAQTEKVISAMKLVQPDITIVLGGPEVSYETDRQSIVNLADYVICGEADLKFAEVCQAILTARSLPGKVISAQLPELSQVILPYDLYNDEDVAHRIIYLEASRGCPFSCEFCLSSLDIPVRQAPLPALLEQLQKLIGRGVRQFKFVDRTFNLNLNVSRALLEFFLERHRAGMFYHFEMIPDRLPLALREVIARFPPGSLQFEVGIQTFNEDVAALISRRQDYARLEDNLHFLRTSTAVHVHADLIAGLPGETLESFAAGFDRLVAMRPQEIQVGILKRLRGTPIVRHDVEWEMVYDPNPPYEILQNRTMDFNTLQMARRFARFWDLIANSGNFVETAPLIWTARGVPGDGTSTEQLAPEQADTRSGQSPFFAFQCCVRWLYSRVGRTDGIALIRLMELLFEFLIREMNLDPYATAEAMWRDYQRGGRSDKPSFLRKFLAKAAPQVATTRRGPAPPKRQARHASGSAIEAGLAQSIRDVNITT
jgi:tRNA A37 methylthiotransferase MiaB